MTEDEDEDENDNGGSGEEDSAGSQSSYAISTKNGIRHKKNADTRKGSGTTKALTPERLWCYTFADATPWVVLHLG